MIAGPVYRLQVSGTRLTGQVRLTVPVPQSRRAGTTAGPATALLAFYNETAKRWQPVPAVYDPAAHTLTAATPHLSLWTTLRLDSGKVLAGATSLLKGFLGAADTTAQPMCPGNTQLAADHITVASDQGNLVKWCAGVSGAGSPLLRVADNRSYAMETDYPVNWSVQRVGAPDSVTNQVITQVTHLLSPAAGGASVIIPGGHTVEFDLPAGSSGEAQTRPSPAGYLIDAFVYGAETLAMTFGDIPGAPKPDASKTAKAVTLAFAAKSCVTQVDGLAHADLPNPHAVGEVFRNDVELAVGCLGDQWEKAYGASGLFYSFYTGVALWLQGGIKLVFNGLRAALDNSIYWRSYRVAVNQTAPALDSFRGPWYVHDGSLCVGQSLALSPASGSPPCSGATNSGWIRSYEGCGSLANGEPPICNAWAEVTFSNSPGNNIVGTVGQVFDTTLNNAVITGYYYQNGYLQPGDTFELQHVATGLLKTVYLKTHLSADNLNYGNPYWCGPGISAANQFKCGA